MKFHDSTEKEKQAMDAVKEAVRALPRGIYIETNEFEGTLEFWKRTPRGLSSAVMIGVLKCKNKIDP